MKRQRCEKDKSMNYVVRGGNVGGRKGEKSVQAHMALRKEGGGGNGTLT